MILTHNAPPADTVTITLEFTEAIGLYKIMLALEHPSDTWADPRALIDDEDVAPLSAALLVQLSAVVGP
jgi:hypothetical protein